MAEPTKGGDANAFIQEYGPIAERIGKQIEVDPRIILAQFGMETGWGKSVVPGTYNLGNIKSAGKGVEATDNVTKSKDRYLKFEDPEVFADYYANYIRRNFPEVIGSGSDVKAFTAGLRPGTQGGYAEDKQYGPKLSSAFSLVSNRIESQPEQNPFERTFGVGEKTEMQRMREEGTTEGGDEKSLLERAIQSPADAAVAGAALLGVPAGIAARSVTTPYVPSESRIFNARERLAGALENLEQARTNAAKHRGVPELELEFKKAQGAYAAAEAELDRATAELKSAKKSITIPEAVPEPSLTPTPDQHTRGIQGTTKETGITGRASQTMYNERTSQIARQEKQAESALRALGKQGVIDPSKAYAMTEGISASTPAGILVKPEEAVVRQAKLEAELAPMVEKEVQAKEARRLTGEARKTAGQALKESQKAQKAVETAQTGRSGVNAAQSSLGRLEKQVPGPLQKAGLSTTGKVASKVAGVISGAGTGMAAYEAIEKAKAGDFSGAVLPTLGAVFGVMSMIPPFHPLAIAARGLGNIGGAALGAYELGKAGKERFIDQPQE